MPRRLPEKTKMHPENREDTEIEADSGRAFVQWLPVEENQEIEVVIDDIGSRGDGIAKIQGYLIFVPRSKMGERVKVKILSVSGKFAVAEKVVQVGN